MKPADLLDILNERAAVIPPTPSANGNSIPSTNGHTPAPSVPFVDGRGPGGRFARGNRFGRGNPFANKVAAVRQALFDAVSPAAVRRIAKKIARMAEEGDLDACKLLLQYLIGRPEAEPIDVDWVAERNRCEQEREESRIAKLEAATDQCLIDEMMALLREPLERIDSLSAEEALAAACAVWGKLQQVHGIEDMKDDPELSLIGRTALTLLEKATPAVQTSQQQNTMNSLLQTVRRCLGLGGGA